MVNLAVRTGTFASLGWWSEHIAHLNCIFLAHQKLESRARPRKMLAHSSRGVSLHHYYMPG
jgi:hypothetical protein